MKKFFAVLLSLAMLLTLAACSSDEPTPSGTKAPNNPNPSPSVPPVEGGETLDASLWTLVYDKEAWEYKEDDFYDTGDFSEIIMIIPDGESYKVNMEIEASVEDAEDFRDYLDSYGFDAYEYAVNNSYQFVNIGGVDCLMQEGNYWGEPCLRYFGRVESASLTVFIEILGDFTGEQAAQLLAGVTFKVQDIGNQDFPWPWDGQPFSASDASVSVGGFTVNSKWIPIQDCIVTKETFDHAVGVSGNTAYLLGDETMRAYAFDGSSLVYQGDIDVGDYGCIQVTNDGSVWISEFMENTQVLQNGTPVIAYSGTDYVTMHPSGKWGVNWFSGPDCSIISFEGSSASSTAITFKEVSTISTVVVDEDYIYVCGSAADDSGHKVFIYDENGTLQMTLTDANGEGLGSITFIAQIPGGFLGLDGNMRDVVLWNSDGSHAGEISDSDLFGTYYPWFCGGTKLSDGSILVIMTEDRADQSAMELVAFLLSGF